jgi:hypothetical protein
LTGSTPRWSRRIVTIPLLRLFFAHDPAQVLAIDDVEHTELTIESIVGTALLEVFDTVLVENVTVHHSRERNDGDGEQR